MDQYTQKTKYWLEERFKKYDERGIYFGHQPIYGFRRGHSEAGFFDKYIVTYQVMKALSHIKFVSLLDVGAAEGYKTYIARELFGVKVKASDLSEEACKRARELFNIESIPADIHSLPFINGEFDVVLCSETLEHVTDLREAIRELLRVASKAIIITVPHESENFQKKNIKDEIVHGHINNFNVKSLDFLNQEGYCIVSKKIVSPLLMVPGALVEAMPREYPKKVKFPRLLVDLYNKSLPILRRLSGEKAMAFLVNLDDLVCKILPFYRSLIFIILKDKKYFFKEQGTKVSAYQIINSAVPYFRLEKN